MASRVDLGYIKGPKGDKGEQGIQGIQGAQGVQGVRGVGISTATPQYYLSTSHTSLRYGSWSNTIPAWYSGRYYWTRTHYVYDDNTSYNSTAVYDSALTEAVSKANTAESDALNAKNDAANALDKVNAMAHQSCTQAEYDNLSYDVKNNGTFYFIN